MATYTESEYPTIISTNGNGGIGGFGGEGWWGIILIALLFGWGRNGFGGGYGGSGSEMLGYELGKMATTNDIASGFNNNAVLSSLNDIKLGMSNAQNYNNQGFAGLDKSIVTATNQLSQGLCTLGYNIATGFNGVNQSIANCCCDLKSLLLENRYINERQTCDLITNNNTNTQKLLDYLQNEKITTLTAENTALKGKISNEAQTATIISALSPKQPIPAYPVFPATTFAYPTGVTFGVNATNTTCGC